MPVGRRTATAAAAAALVLLGAAPAPALAHGAPTSPLSRAAACGPEGGEARSSAACKAAKKAGLAAWDNLRVAGVDGRDRQVIPDGKLCSGGLPAYAGLDLPRADWPATTLTPGAALKVSYRGTIPHRGSFRLFVTKPGYDPEAPLTWDDLQAKPFFSATDPTFSDGAYRMRATLPKGLTGRHLIYTIWQNEGPDTYYSCSDVVFKAPVKPSPKPSPSSSPSPSESAVAAGSASPSAPGEPSPTGSAAATPGTLVVAASDDDGDGTPLAFTIVAVALMALLAAAGLAFAITRAHRARS